MRKNLLQPEVREEILSRINKLNAQTQRQWGKMNVNQMLYHTAAGLRIAYGEITTAPHGNWLKRQLMRFVINHWLDGAALHTRQLIKEIQQV